MIPDQFPQEITEPRILRHRITGAQVGLLACLAAGVVLLGVVGWVTARIKGWL